MSFGMRLCVVWTLLCGGTLKHVEAQPLDDVRRYRGVHPMDYEGNWHLEEGVHEHGALPVGLEAFAEAVGALVFLGDPEAFGYRDTTWTYEGAHPLPARLGRAYCGILETHRHAFAPEGQYQRRTDEHAAYVYVGALHGGVRTLRPGRIVPMQSAPQAAQAPAFSYGSYSPYLPTCAYYTVPTARGSATLMYGGAGCGAPGFVPPYPVYPVRPAPHRVPVAPQNSPQVQSPSPPPAPVAPVPSPRHSRSPGPIIPRGK